MDETPTGARPIRLPKADLETVNSAFDDGYIYRRGEAYNLNDPEMDPVDRDRARRYEELKARFELEPADLSRAVAEYRAAMSTYLRVDARRIELKNLAEVDESRQPEADSYSTFEFPEAAEAAADAAHTLLELLGYPVPGPGAPEVE